MDQHDIIPYADSSRRPWGTPGTPSDSALIVGCLQRIAAATEKTGNLTGQLLNERDKAKREVASLETILAGDRHAHTVTKAKLTKAERLLERHRQALLAIYNHNEATRAAVLQHFPTFKP